MADIELVIKIPERLWTKQLTADDYIEIVNAVANGTPLPKNHGRLKDVNNLYPVCNYSGDCLGSHDDCKQCRDYMVEYLDIIDSPTIIEADGGEN